MSEYNLLWKNQPANADGMVLCLTVISAGKRTIEAALRMMPEGEYELVDCKAVADALEAKKRAARAAAAEPALQRLREKYIAYTKSQNVAPPQPEPEDSIFDEGITYYGSHFIRIKHCYRRAGSVEWNQYDRVVEDNYSIRNFFIDDILKDLDHV